MIPNVGGDAETQGRELPCTNSQDEIMGKPELKAKLVS